MYQAICVDCELERVTAQVRARRRSESLSGRGHDIATAGIQYVTAATLDASQIVVPGYPIKNGDGEIVGPSDTAGSTRHATGRRTLGVW